MPHNPAQSIQHLPCNERAVLVAEAGITAPSATLSARSLLFLSFSTIVTAVARLHFGGLFAFLLNPPAAGFASWCCNECPLSLITVASVTGAKHGREQTYMVRMWCNMGLMVCISSRFALTMLQLACDAYIVHRARFTNNHSLDSTILRIISTKCLEKLVGNNLKCAMSDGV